MTAVQKRAKETEDSLLDAAEALLRKGGLDACTVPEIAALAERSVGAVYRRFPDKDVLLRTVFRRYFERAAEQNRKALAQLAAAKCTLPDLVATFVRGMIAGQRRDRRLIAALLAFARSHPEAPFRRKAAEMSGAGIAAFRELLVARRNEVRHPKPEEAVDVALAVVSLTVQGMLQRDDFNPLPDIDNNTLERELTRMTVGYLGTR